MVRYAPETIETDPHGEWDGLLCWPHSQPTLKKLLAAVSACRDVIISMIPIDAYKIGSGGSKINQTCGFIHFLLADTVNLPMSTHKKIKSWLLF